MGMIIKNKTPYSSSSIIVELTQAEYDALSTQEKNRNVFYCITDVNGDEQSFQPIIYSTEEREIGVWTDGRPIYQKTYVLQSSVDTTANTWSTISGMSLSGAEDIIIKTEVYLAADKSANTGFGKVDNGVFKYYDTIRLLIDAVTIQYTKTTDTPGSGIWTPSGVPAAHYSTDEHIVGTWIDGSTLYEKSGVHVGNVSSTINTYEIIDLTDCNVDKIVEMHKCGDNGSYSYSTTNGLYINYNRSTKKVYIQTAQYTAEGTFYATVRYTKSTS